MPPVQLKTGTCARCRSKKTRCDGNEPCNKCSAANSTCNYPDGAKEGRFGMELKKGAACIPCRKKKKRCDGMLPCRTCIAGRHTIPCTYADNVEPLRRPSPGRLETPNASPLLDISSGSSASSSTLSDTSPSSVDEHFRCITSRGFSPSPFVDAELPDYITFSDLSQARELFVDFAEDRDLVGQFQNMRKNDPPKPDTPTFDLIFESEVQGQVYSLPETPKDKEDELVTIRKLFLNHRCQFGLSVPQSALEALKHGKPLDEEHMHPVLLHACQLLGYMLARHLQHGTWVPLPGQSDREAEQIQLCLGAMKDASTVSYLQTLGLMSSYFFNKGDLVRARDMIENAYRHLQETGWMETLSGPDSEKEPEPAEPSWGFSAGPKTKADQAEAAIAQIVYLDLVHMLILKLPSLLCESARDRLRDQMDRPRSNAEVNFLRAKSALLLWDAQQLAKEYPGKSSPEALFTGWHEQLWKLMESIAVHRSFLSLTLNKGSFCPKLRFIMLSIKVCMILTMTARITLTEVFEVSNKEMFASRIDACLEIMSITNDLSPEDCEYLDPVLSVCWTALIKLVDSCTHQPTHVKQTMMHDPAALASVIRDRNQTLQRLLPFTLTLSDPPSDASQLP